ncbi:MAG: hypothetical protein ACI88H_001831 [Cocleimonas sp.]|jgi:hypothetical protein
MGFLKSIAILMLTTTIVACGGSGGGGTTVIPAPLIKPFDTSTAVDNSGLVTVSGRASPNSEITVTFPDGSKQQTTADSLGGYSVTSNTPQNTGSVKIDSEDSQGNTSSTTSEAFTANLDSIGVLKALYKETGVMPALSFEPSLGINTEAPQGGVDTAGLAMPFADIFRTARPFGELSPSGTAFDENGWPIKFAEDINFARTKMLQGAMGDSIPEGVYTVIYDGGDGGEILEFGSSGSVDDVTKVAGENKYTFDLLLNDFDNEDEVAASDTNAFNMNIRGKTGGTNTIKNIRIAMPGGTCSGNPFLRMDSQTDCPDGTVYESFADKLVADREAIIFNPDYLMLLRNFKVVRMMNLMESSLKKLCFNPTDCPAEIGTWDHRAMLSDAVWGGNDGRTPDEDHKGVPIEVMVGLANTLKRDIWVNMPHVADNDYIKNYAKYVNDNLDPGLQVYVEYSNEVWNPGFAAHNYSIAKGKELNLDVVPEEYAGSVNRDVDYFARLNFYSKRAEEIFILWKSEFSGAGDTRLVRVLGSFIGDTILTKEMLKNVVISNVDAVAIAPYFFGCPYEAQCIDAPKNLLTATTVDDIFDIIDQPANQDVKSLDGTIAAVKRQLEITSANNTKLVTYEGGQHLVTGVFGSVIEDADKPRLRKLFNDANRDPRMKQRYVTFLNAWKDLADDGAGLFTLYTLPQSYYRFGNFGIKEHLNSPRIDSPKFDGVMTFQEAVERCWWDNCNP